jgi:hypothetical protein
VFMCHLRNRPLPIDIVPQRSYYDHIPIKDRVLMTSVSFTSGEIMDIIDALEVKEDKSYLAGDVQLAAYYMQLVNQFQRINDRLSERPGEHRVAELVLAG